MKHFYKQAKKQAQSRSQSPQRRNWVPIQHQASLNQAWSNVKVESGRMYFERNFPFVCEKEQILVQVTIFVYLYVPGYIRGLVDLF